MSEYKFESMYKFLEDQRNYRLPKFIFNALNKGYLEVRGPETDKRLYKIYYRKFVGQIRKTRVLKEITYGMILKNENGQPVIKGLNTRRGEFIEPLESEKEKTFSEIIESVEDKIIKEEKKKGEDVTPKKVKEEAKEPKKKGGRPPKKSVDKSETFSEKNVKAKTESQKKQTSEKCKYVQEEISIPEFKPNKGRNSKRMKPYKFISAQKLLKDIESKDPAFDKLRSAYKKFNLRIICETVYIVYCGVFTAVNPSDYIVWRSNERLVVLKESDIEA